MIFSSTSLRGGLSVARAASFALALGSVWLLLTGSTGLHAQATTPQDALATHIVVLRGDAGAAGLASSYSLGVSHTYQNAFNGFAARVPEGRLRALTLDPRVAWVEENSVFQLEAQGIPNGVRRVGADQNPFGDIDGIDDQRVNVVVAVLDSGVDGSHVELNVNVARSADCTSSTTCVVGTAVDGNGHGTHVAGTIGALDNGTGVVGVAPGAEIWSVRVCGPTGSCALSDIIAAHEYVSANASAISIVNMSLGGQGWSDAWRAAIADNVTRGVVVIVAAGNASADVFGGDGSIGDGNEFIPASFPEAAAISALADSNGISGGTGTDTAYGIDDSLASFSNYASGALAGNPVSSSGGAIDLAAPGVQVLSTYPGDRYSIMSGTSMAAPHVAGVAALYVAQYGRANDSAGVYAIRQALIDGSEAMQSWRTDSGDTASDPDNFHEGAAVAVLGAPTTPPPAPSFEDVAVVGFIAPGVVMEGATSTLIVTARNEGDSPQDVVLQVIDDTSAQVIGSILRVVDPGQETTATFEWTTSLGEPLGQHQIRATVTATADDDPDNNAASATVTVEPAPTADLTVLADATLVPSKRRTAIAISGSVTADSETPAAAVTIVLTTPSGKTRRAETTTSADGTYAGSFGLNPKRDGCGTFDVLVEAVAVGYPLTTTVTSINAC